MTDHSLGPLVSPSRSGVPLIVVWFLKADAPAGIHRRTRGRPALVSGHWSAQRPDPLTYHPSIRMGRAWMRRRDCGTTLLCRTPGRNKRRFLPVLASNEPSKEIA